MVTHIGEDVRSHVAIVGPTASGKSALALGLARELGEFELVSVDSMQVYRGMDIGTAKPSPAEQAEVVHHGIDLVDPDQDFSLSDFVLHVRQVIKAIESRNKRALLVGGTGLYLRAIVDHLELPGQFPEVAAELEAELDSRTLYQCLIELDPIGAGRMEPDNRRRIMRALEVTLGSGRPFSSYGPGIDAYPTTNFLMYGVWLPREVGRQRVDHRVDQMIQAGLANEVEGLQAKYLLSRTAQQALGYKEIINAPSGIVTDEVITEIKARTRSFARRQRVWFRRDPRIRWFGTSVEPELLLGPLLRDLPHS